MQLFGHTIADGISKHHPTSALPCGIGDTHVSVYSVVPTSLMILDLFVRLQRPVARNDSCWLVVSCRENGAGTGDGPAKNIGKYLNFDVYRFRFQIPGMELDVSHRPQNV